MVEQEDKEKFVSASQTQTWVDCHRKFYFVYVEGLRQPPSRAQQRGTNVHKLTERWELDGVHPPDTQEGRMAKALIEHLPPPDSKALVEHKFILSTGKGMPRWLGYIDRIIADPIVPVVLDLKTTSDWFYVKKPVELGVAPQMISYAKYVVDEISPRAEKVILRHLTVIDSADPIAKPISWPVTREGIEIQWAINLERVARMNDLRLEKPGAMDVEPNPMACNMYGGCPFREKCGFTKLRIFKGAMQMPDPSLNDTLKAITGAANGPAQPRVLPPDAPPNLVPPQMSAPVQPPLARPPQIYQGPPGVPQGYYVPQGYAPYPGGASIAVGGAYHPAMHDGAGNVMAMPQMQSPLPVSVVVPPSQALTPPPLLPTPIISATIQQPSGAVVFPSPAPVLPGQMQLGIVVPATTAQPPSFTPVLSGTPPASGPPPPIQAAEEPKRGRGRPRKTAATTAEAAALEDDDGLTIWVDCSISVGAPISPTTAEEWVRPAMDQAAKLVGVPDWRMADFSKGKGAFFASLATLKPPSGDFYVRRTMAGWDLVVEFLTPTAKRVVWGGEAR